MTPPETRLAAVTLNRCRCGSKVVMAYEPGCTFIRCILEREDKLAVPDFAPEELERKWNMKP